MESLVSVIIPTYNRKNLLIQCLGSIEKQDHPYKEIIVIDDASSDDTAAFVKEHFSGVKIIRNSRRLGPAYAKNQGIIHSNGHYVYFLDSDSEIMFSDTISTMIRTMEADSSIGQLGGILELNAEGRIRAVHGYKTTPDGRSYPVSLEKGVPDFREDKLMECDFVPTCNCFVRRQTLLKIGGFDPYYVYMGEDKELGIKIRSIGYKVFFGLKVACLHRFDESVHFDRRFMYLKNKLRFAIKNRGVIYFFITPIFDFFLFFIYYPLVYLLKSIYPQLKITRVFRNQTSPNLKAPGKKWVLLAAYYFAKAYVLNLMAIPDILRCRGINFLLPEQMEAYKVL